MKVLGIRESWKIYGKVLGCFVLSIFLENYSKIPKMHLKYVTESCYNSHIHHKSQILLDYLVIDFIATVQEGMIHVDQRINLSKTFHVSCLTGLKQS